MRTWRSDTLADRRSVRRDDDLRIGAEPQDRPVALQEGRHVPAAAGDAAVMADLDPRLAHEDPDAVLRDLDSRPSLARRPARDDAVLPQLELHVVLFGRALQVDERLLVLGIGPKAGAGALGLPEERDLSPPALRIAVEGDEEPRLRPDDAHGPSGLGDRGRGLAGAHAAPIGDGAVPVRPGR